MMPVIVQDLSALESRVLGRFVAELSRVSEVQQVFLFGSRARRDHRPNSDFDLLIAIEHRAPEIEHRIHEMALDLELAEGVSITTLIIEAGALDSAREGDEPFWRNFRREAIQL